MPAMRPLLPPSSLAWTAGIMWTSYCSGVPQSHFRNVVRNHELGLGSRHDLGGGSSRTGLEQGCLAAGKTDHRQFGDGESHRTHGSERQRAFFDDLGTTILRVV